VILAKQMKMEEKEYPTLSGEDSYLDEDFLDDLD
jgi:hypothetical protein